MSTADDEDRYVYDPETASDRERAAHEAGQRRALEDAADAITACTCGEGDGRTNCENCWWAKWLRDRAAGVGTKDGADDE